MILSKPLIIAYLLAVLANTAQAQSSSGPYEIKVAEGALIPKKHKPDYAFVDNNENVIQIFRRGDKKFAFQKYSKNMQLKGENIIDLEEEFEGKVHYENILKLKSKSYLLMREVFKDEEKEGLTALEFDDNTLSFKGKQKNIFKSSDKVKAYGFRAFASALAYFDDNGEVIKAYKYKTSPDKTKFLTSYSLVNREKSDKINKDVVGLQVFDENLNKQWSAEVEMPYVEAEMEVLNMVLSNSGKVYMLNKVYFTGGKNQDKDAPPYRFEVLEYEKGKSKPKLIKINLDKYFISKAQLMINEKDELSIVGFYYAEFGSSVDGAFRAKLDIENGIVINKKYYEIPDNIIKESLSKRELKKAEKEESKGNDLGLDQLEVKDLYVMDDGSIRLIAEEYEMGSYSYYNGKNYVTVYYSNANSVVVFNINDKDNIEWVRKITKKQTSDLSGYGISIKTMKKGNDIHIFYVDHPDNFDLPANSSLKTYQGGGKGDIIGTSINASGVVKKYNLGLTNAQKTRFNVRKFSKNTPKTLMGLERKGKINMLFTIEVN